MSYFPFRQRGSTGSRILTSGGGECKKIRDMYKQFIGVKFLEGRVINGGFFSPSELFNF